MLTLALIGVSFLILERFLPTRRQPIARPALGTDLLFLAGQQFLFGTIALGVLSTVHRVVGGWIPHVDAPLALQLAVALLLGDLCLYWFHRACHHFDFLWRIHQVHHSSEHLDWAAAYREHPIDGVLTQLVLNLPAMILGVPLGALAGLAIFRGLWAIFIHSNVKLPVGPLLYLFGSPRLHHWHHAKHPTRVANFGNLSPWTDLLFGTFELPKRDAEFELGTPEALPKTWPGLLLSPFRDAPASLALVLVCGVTAFTSFAGDGGVDAGTPDAGSSISAIFGNPQYMPASKSFGAAPGDAQGFGGLGLRGSGSGGLGLGIGNLKKGPGIKPEEPVVQGGLDVEVVKRVVRTHLSRIFTCMQNRISNDAGIPVGKVTVRFVVNATGGVVKSDIAGSTLKDAVVERCVSEAILNAAFPSPKGGGVAVVTYPFVFSAPSTSGPQ